MKKEKLGQENAFPLESKYITTQWGMSKRFYAACAAMQGILSGTQIGALADDIKIVKMSYDLADELLKQENQ